MACLTVRFFSLGLVVLTAACNSGTATPAPTPISYTLCGRQRDNDQRCNPARSACLRQDSYTQCTATEQLYRPELTTSYLSCYPPALACDSASTSAALMCARTAVDQIPVSSTLTLLVNNVCQRCPGVAKDQATDPMTCTTNLTTNANNLALTLRYYTDDTLNRLNTCLVNSSPPADGCIAFDSCFQQLLPPASASSCTADGGA